MHVQPGAARLEGGVAEWRLRVEVVDGVQQGAGDEVEHLLELVCSYEACFTAISLEPPCAKKYGRDC